MSKLIGILCLSLLSGCTYTVHPLLTERDLVNQIDLSGTWELELSHLNADFRPNSKPPAQRRIKLRLEKFDEATYDVTFDPSSATRSAQRDWPTAWTLQVGKIGEQHYGQIIPSEHPPGPPLFGGIPVYYLGRMDVSNSKDKVLFYPLLDPRVAHFADQKKWPHIDYEPSEFVQLTVLTGGSAELREIVSIHTEQIFSDRPLILRRRR